MTSARRPERGAALLVVMVSVAVLTALAANLAYDSRVSLRIAANARDELRASYLARSGVTLSRLVLSFQQDVDTLTKAGGGAGVSGLPRIQLWRLVPPGPELARTLFPPREGGAAGGEGQFEATIDDEARKVNVNLDIAGQTSTGPLLQAQAQAVYQLVCDPRWDPLFEREDALGVRTTREELLARLYDWVDWGAGDAASSLNADFGSASCGTAILSPPFPNSYGDENQPYDRGEERYKVKNARMDSLDELYLVAGVGDAFMAAFGDAFTAYLPGDGRRNPNELDRDGLVALARVVADPPGKQALLSPDFAKEFGERLQKLVVERTFGGIFAMTTALFGALVLEAGVGVDKNVLQTNQNSYFTDDPSTTFRVRATGKAGAVTSSIDAVVWMKDAQAQAGAPQAAPGRLVHWREE